MIKKEIVFFILFFLTTTLYAKEEVAKDMTTAPEASGILTSPTETATVPLSAGDVLDFNSIKEVIKNDGLEQTVIEKTAEIKEEIQKNKKLKTGRYNVPTEEQIWTFLSEYWLIKNAPALNWDFAKPDYGLDIYFREFLEKQGIFEKRFKILLVNTPNLTHFVLPADAGEYIFLLSAPFIKALDLSKQEIALLLFEDYTRGELLFFKKFVMTTEVQALLGTNFSDKKIDVLLFNKIFDKYDKMIFDVGFNFQQQYDVTKRVGDIFKSDLNLWNSYLGLIKKVDELIKNNILYKGYNSIYPSPELQLSWLVPQTKGKNLNE